MEIQETGHDVDYSHPSSAEVKNEENYTSTPPVCLYLNGGQRDKFTVNLQTEKAIKFWYMTATHYKKCYTGVLSSNHKAMCTVHRLTSILREKIACKWSTTS